MTDMSEQEFDAQVTALEQELRDGSSEYKQKIDSIRTDLNSDFASADQALHDFAGELARKTDFEKESTE